MQHILIDVFNQADLSSDLDDIMMFNYPLDVPNMHHSMSGPLPPIHAPGDMKHIMPPSLIHSDEDSYSSLPPTPTSPLELSASHLGWHNSITGAHGECGQNMYGMNSGMGQAMGLGQGDVAIAGSGQYMGVSGCLFAAYGVHS